MVSVFSLENGVVLRDLSDGSKGQVDVLIRHCEECQTNQIEEDFNIHLSIFRSRTQFFSSNSTEDRGLEESLEGSKEHEEDN